MSTLFLPDVIYTDGAFRRGHGLAIDDDGAVIAVGPPEQARAAASAAGAVDEVRQARRLVIPGHVSAHSHCFQVLLRGRRPEPRDFPDWVERILYPVVCELDEASLRAGALLAFSEMARAGITTVGEFHYVHNAADGLAPGGDPNRNARIVIDAARAVGLRIALLRTCYDTVKRDGQRRFSETPGACARAVVDLAAAVRDERGVSVMPAPHSLHGASAAMIEAAIGAATELDTRFHIHLAEQPGDEAFAKERYGKTPLRALESLGGLGPRTVLIHGLYLHPDERRDLAVAGGGLVVNPTTNAHLGDGTTDLADVIRAGITLGLGTDADQAPSLFDEMRAVEYASRSAGTRMGVAEGESDATGRDGARWLLDAATAGGASALALPVGRLAVGERADFTVIDLDDLSLAPVGTAWADAADAEADPELDLAGSLLHAIRPTAVREVFVDGRPIVRDGEVLGVPRGKLIEELRNAKLVR